MDDTKNRLVFLNGEEHGLEIVEAMRPRPGPGEVLVRVEIGGVCGTDVHYWTGQAAYPAPMVLGHEGVGIVEALGGGVERDFASNPISLGDRVAWVPEVVCGRCYSCVMLADSSLCENSKLTCPPGDANWATFADFALLPREMAFFRISESTPSEAVSAFGCALPTLLQAVERAGGLRPGDDVVIQGSGPVGLAATMLAKVSGARSVVVVGRPRHRLEAALSLGADRVIDIGEIPDEETRRAAVLDATDGRGAALVVEATGVLGAMEEGLRFLAPGGRYLVVGLWGTPGDVSLPPSRLNNLNQRIIGSSYCQARHYYQAIRVVETHHERLPIASVVSHRYALEDAAEALTASRQEQTLKAVVMPLL
ncbi:MAG: hypothetical protein QOE75_914 [Solirubrobacterales bacterium]|jgi:5-exo-hydroxycamphor dehydrogenase|nr:hypothetical protein [Solirubrobacterales bacterium]